MHIKSCGLISITAEIPDFKEMACLRKWQNLWEFPIFGSSDFKRTSVYVQIECKLSYQMMLLLNGICQYDGKYVTLNKIYAIFGTVTERFPTKNTNQRKTFKLMQCCALHYFFRKTRSVTVTRFDLF